MRPLHHHHYLCDLLVRFNPGGEKIKKTVDSMCAALKLERTNNFSSIAVSQTGPHPLAPACDLPLSL